VERGRRLLSPDASDCAANGRSAMGGPHRAFHDGVLGEQVRVAVSISRRRAGIGALRVAGSQVSLPPRASSRWAHRGVDPRNQRLPQDPLRDHRVDCAGWDRAVHRAGLIRPLRDPERDRHAAERVRITPVREACTWSQSIAVRTQFGSAVSKESANAITIQWVSVSIVGPCSSTPLRTKYCTRSSFMADSIPVWSTTPSDCAALASPVQTRAPGLNTGRNSDVPSVSSATSRLPPYGPARIALIGSSPSGLVTPLGPRVRTRNDVARVDRQSRRPRRV
jgi:hypothetical protein